MPFGVESGTFGFREHEELGCRASVLRQHRWASRDAVRNAGCGTSQEDPENWVVPFAQRLDQKFSQSSL